MKSSILILFLLISPILRAEDVCQISYSSGFAGFISNCTDKSDELGASRRLGTYNNPADANELPGLLKYFIEKGYEIKSEFVGNLILVKESKK